MLARLLHAEHFTTPQAAARTRLLRRRLSAVCDCRRIASGGPCNKSSLTLQPRPTRFSAHTGGLPLPRLLRRRLLRDSRHGADPPPALQQRVTSRRVWRSSAQSTREEGVHLRPAALDSHPAPAVPPLPLHARGAPHVGGRPGTARSTESSRNEVIGGKMGEAELKTVSESQSMLRGEVAVGVP